jgi:hypothetical protein
MQERSSFPVAIRPIALNRRNALFAGRYTGPENAATIASLIGTCKLKDLDPLAYSRLDQLFTSKSASRKDAYSLKALWVFNGVSAWFHFTSVIVGLFVSILSWRTSADSGQSMRLKRDSVSRHC